ncbi:MAG TPA: sialidase family protein [Anaerolineales bacterium]|nr:sialidase family protein [Anaerolineales bacterium]
MNFSAIKRISLGVLLTTLVLLLGSSRTVPAQESVVETWAVPENLSQSGYTSNPAMVVTPTGTIFAVWADEFQGAVFSRRTDEGWSAPTAANFPWAAGFVPGDTTAPVYQPLLLADNAGLIHAIWIGAENILNYSYTQANQFGLVTWATTQVIAQSVIRFDAQIDDQRVIHMAYVSILDTVSKPAGVYYTRRNPFTNVWNTSIRLYDSPYLRGLTTNDVEVSLLITDSPEGGQNIYTAWDNRPRRQLFLARSGNDGASWDAPLGVVGPAGILDTDVPSQVELGVHDNRIIQIWKESAADLSTSCIQYYQVFELDGTPVTAPQFMLQELSGCPLGSQTLINTPEALVLQTEVFDEVFLVGWDGEQWSAPQVQIELSNFTDAETFQTILLACLQVAMDSADQLHVIGCDKGAAGDIWFSSRSLIDIQSWFSGESTWRPLATLASAGGEISPVTLVADAGNLVHAVWAQSDSTLGDTKSIRYARWDGLAWTFILTIIEPPFGKVDFMDTTIDKAADRLYLIWNGGERGEIYFSWANAGLAGSPSEWAPPFQIPMDQRIGSSSDVHVGWTGEVFVTYAVPVNEGRGIYLTRSADNGINWSASVQILDGAGWEIVGQPALTQSTDGVLHLLAERLPPLEGSLQKQLYYSRSTDNGLIWSPPVEVMTGDLQIARIDTTDGLTVFRLWQEKEGVLVTNFYEFSTDGGSSWGGSTNFIGLAADLSVSDLVIDVAGQIHLLQITEGGLNDLRLQEWVWDGETWSSLEIGAFGTGRLSANSSAAVAINNAGYLSVLVSMVDRNNPGGMELAFTERELVVTAPPVVIVTPSEPPVETVESPATPEATATATPEPTPEPVVPENDGNLLLQLIIGFSIAVLVVSIAFFFINRVARRT